MPFGNNIAENEEVDKVLVSQLMCESPSCLWSTKGLDKDASLFYITFDPKEFQKPEYRGYIESLGKLSREQRKQFVEIIKQLASDISKTTGVKFEFKKYPNPAHENVLIIHACELPEGMNGVTKSLRTEDGTPDTPAILKHICIDTENVKKSLLPEYDFELAAKHEFGHAMGLDHPTNDEDALERLIQEYRLGYTPTLEKTVMAARVKNQKELMSCLEENFNNPKSSEICGKDLPAVRFTEEDRIAINEQVKRSKDSNYVSAYDTIEDAPDLIKDISDTFKSGMSAFLAAFARTLIQHYIKPLLIDYLHIKNQTANLVGYSIQLSLEAYLYSLPNVIISNVIGIILDNALSYWQINRDDSRVQLLLAAVNGAILGFPDKIISSMVGATMGYEAAWGVIHSLPKLKVEGESQPEINMTP